MHCPNCGNPVNDGEKFCANCGTNLEQVLAAARVNAQPAVAPETPVAAPKAPEPAYVPPTPQPVYVPPTPQPAYVPPTPEPTVPVKKKKKTGLIIALILAAVLLAAAAFCVWYFVIRIPEAESISLSKSDLVLQPGEKKQITYTIEPEKAGKKSVEWSSSDNSVATVDENGQITARDGGECRITASVDQQTASVKITVLKMEISESRITLNRAQEHKLVCSVLPKQPDGMTVEWKSTNTSVATVDQNGTVCGVGEGTCEIVAEMNGQSVRAEVKVNKLHEREALILGKWYGKSALVDDDVISYNGTLTLNDDLTGFYTIADTTYDLTWEYFKDSDDLYVFYEYEKDGAYQYHLLYDPEDDTLALGFDTDFILVFHR